MTAFKSNETLRAEVARSWPAESPVLASWDKALRLVDAGAPTGEIVKRLRMTSLLADKALEVLSGTEMCYRGTQESMEAISEVERIQKHAESLKAFLTREK